MRSPHTFTDGRIHVTLCHGPFDLAALRADDRLRYGQLLDLYTAGASAATLEERGGHLCIEATEPDVIEALCADLCDRVLVTEHGELPEDELLPWKVDAMRRTVRRVRQSLALAS